MSIKEHPSSVHHADPSKKNSDKRRLLAGATNNRVQREDERHDSESTESDPRDCHESFYCPDLDPGPYLMMVLLTIPLALRQSPM
ncbi:hypothetical protein ANO14919_119680 [Xylariales sp. No.14919]|nr:hypothetical protein ANO14919_119680 [Xylariales sp. No.14919]